MEQHRFFIVHRRKHGVEIIKLMAKSTSELTEGMWARILKCARSRFGTDTTREDIRVSRYHGKE